MKYLIETMMIFSLLFILGVSAFVVWDASHVANEQDYWQSIHKSEQCDKPLEQMSIGGGVLETGSMRPTITKHSTLISTQYNKSLPLVQGDIVGVRTSKHSNTLHRVTGIHLNYFTMKGDNNARPDGTRYSYGNISFVVCGVLY